MGTELQRRGLRTLLPLWSTHALLNAPELVSKIHKDYVEAGAQVLTANTFRTSRYTLSKTNMEFQAEELTHRAVQLAREAASSAPSNQSVQVAGSMAPLEDCYQPELTPSDDILRREHQSQAEVLAAVGVDVILVETQNTIREARIATESALSQSPSVWVSLLPMDGQALYSGESLQEAVLAIAQLKPAAILVNCCPPQIAREAIHVIQDNWGGLSGAYPNFGRPEDERETQFTDFFSPAKFAEWARKAFDEGMKIIGGCCGTRPEHIAALSKSISKPR